MGFDNMVEERTVKDKTDGPASVDAKQTAVS